MVSQFARLAGALILGIVISSAWGCAPAENATDSDAETSKPADDHGHDHDGGEHKDHQ